MTQVQALPVMEPKEYKAAVEKLGLTAHEAAVLLGVDDRTSRRWAAGERDVPGPAQQFLRYLVARRTSGHMAIGILGRKRAA
jgi:DNA-binding transcriptional regulator YiaG